MFSRARIATFVVLVAGALVMASGTAQAQGTASANFNVTATVVNRCTINAAALAFGNYDPTSATAVTAQSDVTVSCTRGAVTWTGLDDGQHVAGTQRQMLGNTTEMLPYTLYREGARTNEWRNTLATGVSWTSTGRAAHAITVYGTIPAGADVSAGAFTDTVQATVHF
jgi:spore coat protein U-like protein